MARKAGETRTPAEAVETRTSAGGLPTHLAGRLNPQVLARRAEKIRAALSDEGVQSGQRRRYLETIVDHHLWEELKNA